MLELIHKPDNTTDRIEYYWGKDLSGSLQGAGGIGGLLYLKRDGAIYVPFYDAYGNILGYYDATGNVVASYTYDAFGRTISQSGLLADTFSFRYSTKYFDPETGLYYYGYRYYSPELRRWLTRDPIDEEGGVNLYSLCANASVFLLDHLDLTEVSLVFTNSLQNTSYGQRLFATVQVVVKEPPSDNAFIRIVQLRRARGDVWRVDYGSSESPYYYSAGDMNRHKIKLRDGSWQYNVFDAPSGQVDDVDFYVAVLEVSRTPKLCRNRVTRRSELVACFDRVELLASLAWRYNVKMLGQGYQQVTFAEIGGSKMEMKNELKSILGTESWRHLVCPVVNISMK